MSTKNHPGQFDCYQSAEPDEPMFVLLARDRHAPVLIWLWATMREIEDEDSAHVAEARQCVAQMIEWQRAHGRTGVGLGHAALMAIMELIRAANYGVDAVTASTHKTTDDTLRCLLAKTVIAPE